MTVKISISISEEQAEYARRKVAEGRFSSTSAVIQQALEARRQADEEYSAWKAGFVEMMNRRAEGAFVPLDTFRARIDAMMDEKERMLGLDG